MEELNEATSEPQVAGKGVHWRSWKLWACVGVSVVLVGTVAGVAYSRVRVAALEELSAESARAVAACGVVSPVDPELLAVAGEVTDVTVLEELSGKVMAYQVPETAPVWVGSIRNEIRAAREATRSCEELGEQLSVETQQVTQKVIADLKDKYGAAEKEGQAMLEAAREVDQNAAGKIEGEVNAQGVNLRTALNNSILELIGAFVPSFTDGWDWKMWHGRVGAFMEAKTQLETDMKALQDAFALWQHNNSATTEDASVPAAHTSVSVGAGGGASGWAGNTVSTPAPQITYTPAPTPTGGQPTPPPAPAPQPTTNGDDASWRKDFVWGDEWVPSHTCDTQGNCAYHW